MRALVVEDEEPFARLVRSYLEREGFEVDATADGETAVALARERSPDVIVLDLMLPGIDGVEACRRIRAFSDAYVVMLTSRAEEADKIVGLSTGADDYLTKPFSPAELVARIRAMLRRPRSAGAPDSEPPRRFGDLVLDPLAREVRRDGEPVELTRLEFDLLDALSERPRLAFSRRQLLERVWGPTWFGDAHVTPSGRRVVLSAHRRDGALELAVADEGEGLGAEQRERVFERFYRADPSRSREHGGTGIGLTIARAIVDAHGGRIHAESDGAGRGARFVVELPAAGDTLAPVRP